MQIDEKSPKIVVKSHFQNFDTNNSGTLDKNEVREFCYSLGYYLDDDQLEILFLSADSNSDGNFSFEEFYEAMHHKGYLDYMAVLFSEQGKQCADYFRYFDADKSGVLSHEEFRLLYGDLQRYGMTKGTNTVDEALTILDKDNDGKVEFNEYMTWVGLYE